MSCTASGSRGLLDSQRAARESIHASGSELQIFSCPTTNLQVAFQLPLWTVSARRGFTAAASMRGAATRPTRSAVAMHRVGTARTTCTAYPIFCCVRRRLWTLRGQVLEGGARSLEYLQHRCRQCATRLAMVVPLLQIGRRTRRHTARTGWSSRRRSSSELCFRSCWCGM